MCFATLRNPCIHWILVVLPLINGIYGQDTTVNFWSAVTPKALPYDTSKLEKCLQLIAALPVSDLELHPNIYCPDDEALKGAKDTPQHFDRLLKEALRLRRLGYSDCSFFILKRLTHLYPRERPELQLTAYTELIYSHLLNLENKQADSLSTQALQLAADRKLKHAGLLWVTALTAHRNRRTELAREQLVEALKVAQAEGNQHWEMRTLSAMGVINRDVFFGHTLKAIPDHSKALAIAKSERDTFLIINELVALALNYGDAGKFDLHFELLNEALAYLQRFENIFARMRIQNVVCEQLAAQHRNAELIHLRKEALRLAEMSNSMYASDILLRLVGLYMETKQWEKAKDALDHVRHIYEKAGMQIPDMAGLEQSYYVYAKNTGQTESALQHLENAFASVSENYVQRNAELLSRLETEYRTGEKERLLQTTRQQRSWLLVLAGLITLLGGFVFVGFLRQRKTSRTLRLQNAKIQQQSEELKSLEQLKSRFFANVSHELRTPLTLMLGPIGTVLHDSTLNEKNTVLLQSVRKSGNQLLALINEILDLSKLEAGKMSLNETPTHLHELLRYLYAQFESHARFKGIDLEFQNLIDPNTHVLLDRKKAEHIVSNLLSNALKFTDKGGKVTLRCCEENDKIRITIQDNGRGIHPDDLPHIFKRFYQGKHGSLSAEGGTGIGLSLSAELAELMNGALFAESTPGQGSTFICTFPLRVTEQSTGDGVFVKEKNEEGSLLHLIATKSSVKTHLPLVLVVEDNPGLQQFLTLILQEKYVVETAGNGREALDWLSGCSTEQLPNLILSDVMMPQMDGFQLLEHLKNDDRYRHLPVVMLTARAELADKLNALRMGVDDYMLKPFDEEELMARVENLLKFAQLRYEAFQKQKETSARTKHPLERDEPVPAQLLSQEAANWLKLLEECIKNNIENPYLSVEFLAQQMSVSARHLQRQLKAISGLNLNQYIQEARLQHSRHLLERGNILVKQVSAKVGYRDVKHFARLYKERFGKLPSMEE